MVEFREAPEFKEKPVEDVLTYKKMIALSDDNVAGFLCSVMPKLKCNILTIVRLDRPIVSTRTGHFCFSPLFLSSKEDISLAVIMELFAGLVKAKDFTEKGKNDLWQIIVHTDTRNPPYANNAVVYTGKKALVLPLLCESSFFRDAEGSALNAAGWKNTYEFRNMWDVIKMQESALYQLIESIGKVTERASADALKQIRDYFFVVMQ